MVARCGPDDEVEPDWGALVVVLVVALKLSSIKLERKLSVSVTPKFEELVSDDELDDVDR